MVQCARKRGRIILSATPPDTGQQAALNGSAAREVSTATGSVAASPSSGSAAPRRLGLALAVIATAQLMVVLDATIVNVAQAHIQHALGFSGRTWSGSSTRTRWRSAGCCCSAGDPA